MSFRKNVLIALAIVVLCMLLVMQLIGNRAPQTTTGKTLPKPESPEHVRADEEAESIIQLSAVVHMRPEQFQAFSELRDSVRGEMPNVQVELTNVAEDGKAMAYYKEQARLGQSPDIMLLANEFVGEFAAAGFLSHQLERYMQVRKSKIDGLIGWNGYTWAIPYETDPYVIVTNITEAAGFAEGEALPASAEGWLQLRDIRSAEGLQEGILYVDAQDPYALVSLIWALGGEWAEADNGMLQLAPESVPLLDMLYGFRVDDGKNGAAYPLLVPGPLSLEEKWERFEQGGIPIMVVRYSELAERGHASIQPLTTLVENPREEGLWISGTSFAVSSVSEHPGEAYKWLDAMIEKDQTIQETMLRSFGQDPELRSKMALLAFVMPELSRGLIPPEEMNNRLSELWSVR